jgi:hypothetical protein
MGALVEADAKTDLSRLTLRAAREVTGIRYPCIEAFNEATRTDFTTIRAVLDRAHTEIIPGNISHPSRYGLAGFLNWCRDAHRRFAQTAFRKEITLEALPADRKLLPITPTTGPAGASMQAPAGEL